MPVKHFWRTLLHRLRWTCSRTYRYRYVSAQVLATWAVIAQDDSRPNINGRYLRVTNYAVSKTRPE